MQDIHDLYVELLGSLRVVKGQGFDSSTDARHWAIALTELEKASPYWMVYCWGPDDDD